MGQGHGGGAQESIREITEDTTGETMKDNIEQSIEENIAMDEREISLGL